MTGFSPLLKAMLLSVLVAGLLSYGQETPPPAAGSTTGGPPYLGITMHPVNHPLARQLGVIAGKGAVLTRVVEGAPAHKAGLLSGDVVVQFGDTPIATCDDLQAALGRIAAGDSRRVHFYRGNNLYSVVVTAGQKPSEAGNEFGLSIQRKLFDGKSTFMASIGVRGLFGSFPQDSPEMVYYKFRWLPGSLEIASLEEDFPVEGAKMPTDRDTFALISGYQASGTPVTVEVKCTETPEPEDTVQDGSGWRYQCVGHKVELLQFAGHDAPGLYSIEVTEPRPGTFTWTPQKYDSLPHVCGPQVVGVYVIYDMEGTRYEGGQATQSTKFSKPYRVAWLFLGCPGDTVEQDNQQYLVRDPREQPAAGGAGASVYAPGTQQTYTHVEGAYRFRLPAGWRVVASNRDGPPDPLLDTLHSPDGKLTLLCGRVHQDGEEPRATFEQYIREKTVGEVAPQVAHFALKGTPAVRISYLDRRSGGHVSRLTFILAGKRYVINVVARDNADTTRLDQRASEILDTLEFLKDVAPANDSLTVDQSEATIGPDGLAPDDRDTVDPLPGEAAAMAAVNASPSRENLNALARIRAQYAMSLLDTAQQKRDENLLRLAARYSLSATELAPAEPLHWFLLAQVYAVNEGNSLADNGAMEAAEKALALAPEDNRIRLFVGQLKFRQELYASALDLFERSIASDVKLIRPPLVAMMTTAYLRDLQIERGQTFLAGLLEKQPGADAARLALAILMHQAGKEQAASAELRKVAESATASPENRQYAKDLPELWAKELKEDAP